MQTNKKCKKLFQGHTNLRNQLNKKIEPVAAEYNCYCLVNLIRGGSGAVYLRSMPKDKQT